jgi:hypothetical protein
MRRVAALLVTALLVVSGSPARAQSEPGQAAAADTPRLLLDGWPLSFAVPPQLIGGRTMVPFRAIAEALGITVQWEESTRTIRAEGQGRSVALRVDDPLATVGGGAVRLDVPPTIIEGRTLVPLRFFSEAFGADVAWESETRTVSIRSPLRSMEGLAFYAIRSYGEIGLIPHFGAVAFGWSSLAPDGRVLLDGPSEYRWPEPDGEVSGESIIRTAMGFGVRRYLMVHRTDRDDLLTRLVLDESLSAAAASSMAAAARDGGWDGILLDLEGLGLDEQGEDLARLRSGFTRLVRMAGEQLRADGRGLLVAVHAPNSAYKGYDLRAIAAHADRLILMAHDYVRVGDGVPEPADRVDEAVRLTLEAGVSRSQVLLALNIWVETPESTAVKAGLAKRYSLAGISVWRLGLIGDERIRALVESVTFHRSR